MVQTAVKIVIEPVLEADLSPYTFGYRPRKSALDAIKIVQNALNQGYTDVVDADLSKYFDTIPHSELLKSIAARISDRTILRLIKMWLKAPVEERDENGGRRMSGGKAAKKGTPQGGVISPLLANRYMNRFLKYWAKTEQPRRLRARTKRRRSRSSASTFCTIRSTAKTSWNTPTSSPRLIAARSAWTGSHSRRLRRQGSRRGCPAYGRTCENNGTNHGALK